MKDSAKFRSTGHKLLISAAIGISMATGCGGGGTSSGVGNIFDNDCRISDPGFPFCGGDWVRCRDQDEVLYQVYKQVCPAGWTVVPDDVAFPNRACTNPGGQTFNVDAERCPPGWTQFTFSFSLSTNSARNN